VENSSFEVGAEAWEGVKKNPEQILFGILFNFFSN